MKKLALLTALSLIITACDDAPKKHEKVTGATARANQSAAANAKQELPIVKVATFNDLVPFAFEDDTGNLIGIDIEIIRAIAADQGFEVQIFQEQAETLAKNLYKGQYDMVISAISYTEERAKMFGYTESYATNPSIAAYVRQDLNLKVLEDVADLKIGVLALTRQKADALSVLRSGKLIEENSLFDLYKGLVSKKYDVVLLPRSLFLNIANRYPEHKIKYLQYQDDKEPEAQLVIYTNKAKTELLDKLNRGLEKLKSSGELERIKKKYEQKYSL